MGVSNGSVKQKGIILNLILPPILSHTNFEHGLEPINRGFSMRKTVYLDDFLPRPLSRINLIDEYSTRNGFYLIYRLYVGYLYPGVAAGRPQGASAQLHPGSAEPQPTPQSKEAPPSLCDGENGAG